MGLIKDSKVHALIVHESSKKSYLKYKDKGKGKAHSEQEEEGNSFEGSFGSKGRKRKKGKPKCGYCNCGSHHESTCVKKQIDLIVEVLQKSNLGAQIPWDANKKSKYKVPTKRGNYHALINSHSSPHAWILDLGASHHMEATKDIFSYLTASAGPPILIGDDTLVEVTRQGRVELQRGSFDNVFHVPKLSMNLLSIYQITQSGKRVEFTMDYVTIYDMHDNSNIIVGEFNHQSRLYTFSKLIAKSDSSLLLTHSNGDSRFGYDIFGNLIFKYM